MVLALEAGKPGHGYKWMTTKKAGGEKRKGGGLGHWFQVTGQESMSLKQLKGLALAWGPGGGGNLIKALASSL